jgi:hypothetical protein
VAGLLPCLILYALAPAQFTFGVFTYSLEAPQQFWAAVGQAERLTVAGKLGGLALETLKGATLVALLLWGATFRRGGVEQRLFDCMIAGGLLAAWLPDPFFKQYLVPLLPALFARTALSLPSLTLHWRQVVIGAGVVTTAVGATGTAANLATAFVDRPELIDAVDRAGVLAEIAKGELLVTLSPEQFAGGNVRLHSGFAAGPFLFRAEGDLAKEAERVLAAPTFATLEGLAGAIIVTGGERKPRPPLLPDGLDAALDGHAIRSGYQSFDLGEGWTLWMPPPPPPPQPQPPPPPSPLP